MSEWVTYTRQKLMWLLNEAGDDHVAEVSVGEGDTPWKYRMRVFKGSVSKGPSLASGKWDEVLYHAVRSQGRAYIIYKENNFFLGIDPGERLSQVGKVMDFEIVGRKVLGKRDSKRKAINSSWKDSGIYFYRFGRVLTSDIYGLALYLYGEINPYSVGQAYSWNNQNQYEPREFSGEYVPFQVGDFIAAGNHYNSRGRVSGAAFCHKFMGVLNGLDELKKAFPEATADQIRELYREFDLPPSTHIGDFFGVTKPRVGRRNANSTTGEKPKTESIDYYGSKYKMYRTRQGYLNFVGTIGEMVAMSPEKLYEMLIDEGESVSRKLANKIWVAYMEDGDDS